jgi:hypothetical protein
VENLAGNEKCDVYIEKELTRCGIEVVRNQTREGEVPSSLRGKLGQFTFRRTWRYWVVNGPVPIAIANELYADAVGRTDIRVNEHRGCPAPGSPGGNIEWLDRETKKILITRADWGELQDIATRHPGMAEGINAKYQACDDPTSGNAFIMSYHIDTEVGLRLFADTLKKHNLV